MAPTASSATKSPKKATTPARVLYLYAISEVPKRAAPVISAEAIDGDALVEPVRCENYVCWVSRVAKDEFADHIEDRMQDLEWLASAGLRHQRVVAEISSKLVTLPARFGTVFLSEDSLAAHVKERKRALRGAFERVAGADEWGVKLFATAAAKAPATNAPASGAEYLKRKAELLQPRSGKLDTEVREFVARVKELAVAASAGGKASAGQPGLIWHGSFLIRRKNRKKLEMVLRKYAKKWKDIRRIDCSGPWPPYSFVGQHVD